MGGIVKSVLVFAVAVFVGAFALNAGAAPAAGDKCSGLMKNSALRALPNATLTLSETVEGSFLPPGEKEAIPNLPSFCRVAATLKPGPTSDVRIEIWMPTSGWNGKLEGIGNSGLGGTIAYNNVEPGAFDKASLADAVKAGYAGVSTDTGHEAKDRTWLTNEDKMRDYGYRAIHAMTVTAKAVIQQFYGSPAKEAYFNGCSAGGGQALGEAQRYPDDYNGILAGAPQNYLTHTRAVDLWKYQMVADNPKARIPAKLLTEVTRAALYLCGGGVGADKDGFFSEDPRECWFGPEALLCTAGNEGNAGNGDPAPCLTAAQVDVVMKLYGGYWIPGTHIQVMPGFPVGSAGPEGPGNVGWDKGPYLRGGPITNTAAGQFYAVSVLGDPSTDLSKIDIGKAMLLADKKFGYINHTSLDLSAFMQRGGKLLIYQGWNDPDVPIYNMIDYYSSMVDAMQRRNHIANHVEALADAQKSARFFAIPGMGHCGGGPGPNSFDALGTIDQWVEQGVAPERIVATHVTKSGEKTFTRPLFPYPQWAQYSGKGDRKDAANWVPKKEVWNWELYDRYFYAPELAPKQLTLSPAAMQRLESLIHQAETTGLH